MNRAARFANLNETLRYFSNQKKSYSPSNIKQGYRIKWPNNVSLHFCYCWWLRQWSIIQFPSTPPHFNVVCFTMVFRVKINQVSSLSDEFFKSWFLVHKIRLRKQYSAATAICAAWRTLKSFTLGIETRCWPKSTLSYDLFHPFEPAAFFVIRAAHRTVLRLRPYKLRPYLYKISRYLYRKVIFKNLDGTVRVKKWVYGCIYGFCADIGNIKFSNPLNREIWCLNHDYYHIWSILMIGAHKYGKNFTNSLFYLHEKVVFMCILPDFGVKIGSQSLANNLISL